MNETIEDFSRHGIEDLRSGVLRTPIDAVRTLRDDPLRALRAIRFMYVASSHRSKHSNIYPHLCSKGPLQLHVGARPAARAHRPRSQTQIIAGSPCQSANHCFLMQKLLVLHVFGCALDLFVIAFLPSDHQPRANRRRTLRDVQRRKSSSKQPLPTIVCAEFISGS